MKDIMKFLIVNLCLYLMAQVVNAKTVASLYFPPVEEARRWDKIEGNISEIEVRRNLDIVSREDLFKSFRNVEEQEKDLLYQNYVQNELDFQLSATLLERILDQESLKLGIELEIPLNYVNFSLKYILTNNAINLNILTEKEANSKSYKELYQYILDLIQSAESERGNKLEKIDFTIDWKEGLRKEPYSYSLYSPKGNGIKLLDFPTAKITFFRTHDEILPDNFIDFEIELRKKLNRLYRKLVREYTWNALLGIEYAQILPYITEVDIGEHYRMYDKHKEEFFSYYDNIAVFEQVEFKGPEHKKAMQIYLETLKSKLSIELKELKARYPRDEEGRILEKDNEAFNQERKLIETQLPKEVLALIQDKLIRLNIESDIKDTNIAQDDLMSNNFDDVEKEKLGKLFNMQSLMTFFPHTKIEKKNSSSLFFLRNLKSSDQKKYYEAYSDRARGQIEFFVRSKDYLDLYSKLLEKVLFRNSVDFILPLCEENICSSLNINNYHDVMPKLLFGKVYGNDTLSLFEQRLFKNKNQDEINVQKFMMFKDIFSVDLTKR